MMSETSTLTLSCMTWGLETMVQVNIQVYPVHRLHLTVYINHDEERDISKYINLHQDGSGEDASDKHTRLPVNRLHQHPIV